MLLKELTNRIKRVKGELKKWPKKVELSEVGERKV